MPVRNLTLTLCLHGDAILDQRHPNTHPLEVCGFVWMLGSLSKHFSCFLPSFLLTFAQQLGNNLNKAVILYNGPSNPYWQLQPQRHLKYGPSCHFNSTDSGWQLRGTTTDWGYMRGSLSDDSTDKIESCDVMETRLLTDTMKEASLSAPVHNHSYQRSMSG